MQLDNTHGNLAPLQHRSLSNGLLFYRKRSRSSLYSTYIEYHFLSITKVKDTLKTWLGNKLENELTVTINIFIDISYVY